MTWNLKKQPGWRFLQCCWLLLLVIFAVSGCATIRVQRVDPGPVIPSDYFMAGIGRSDITPPPGMPLFGYSKAGKHNGVGFRTRLYVRAMYLEDANGERVALVQCDLGAISALLHRKVAQAITKETGITVDRLLIGATHTHSGPGGYFGVAFYNFWGANESGFDKRVLNFLARHIVDAVLQAYRTRAPAKLAIGQTHIYGLTRNRSIEAYNNNTFHVTPNQAPSGLPPEYRAIDPTLTMLRVDPVAGAGTQPLGVFTNFAIHGTAISPANDLYSGDVHAAAERALEWAIQRQYGLLGDAVHVLTNGTEGDISPAFSNQGFPEAERLGLALAAKAFDLFTTLDNRLTDKVHIRHNYEEVSLLENHSVDEGEVCQRAMVGCPVLGGSEEGRSDFHALIPEGFRKSRPECCQGWKEKALGPFQDLHSAKDFPTMLTLQTIQINELLLVTVPGEMTTEMGQRVKQASLEAAQLMDERVKQVAVVGLANQYVSYFTTPEEYALQHYEGASTLYGPASGPFIAVRLARLIEQMADDTNQPDVPRKWKFSPGLRARYFPREKRLQGEQEAQHVELELTAIPPHVRFVWQCMSPGSTPIHMPQIRIERQISDERWMPLRQDYIPVDDRGLCLEIRYLPYAEFLEDWGWRATWYPQRPFPAGNMRFVVAAQNGLPDLYSEPFSFEREE